MYRILSFDGGGIRGVFTATVLERLERDVPELVRDVQLFAGTSTGGIIALAMAAGRTAESVATLYVEHGRDVFDDSWLDDIRDVGRVVGAEYGNRKFRELMLREFGSMRLGDLKTRVLIPAFDLDASPKGSRPRVWKPKFFHNFEGPDSDADELVVDVALRTCAAPTYFPSYQGFVDGGVVANNPSMAALAQVLHEQKAPDLRSIRLLSLGTGRNPMYIAGDSLDWGYAQWAKPLVTLMIEGSMGVADYQCAQLLGANYLRFDPYLDRVVPLDDVSQIPYLRDAARRTPLTFLEGQDP